MSRHIVYRPRKFTRELLNDARRLISGGENLTRAARILHVSPGNLSEALKIDGFSIPNNYSHIWNRIVLGDAREDEICSAYIAGESELSIANRLDVARAVIRKVLLKRKVEIRGRSASMYNRMLQTSEAERKRLTEAAHAAVRGQKRSESEVIRRAQSKEVSKGILIGFGENDLAQALIDAGFQVTTQKAVDRYNVDIFVHPDIAVELRGKSFSIGSMKKSQGKIEKFRELNLKALWVFFSGRDTVAFCAEKIIADIKLMYGNDSFIGKNRVIACRVNTQSRIRNERGQFTMIPAPKEAIYRLISPDCR